MQHDGVTYAESVVDLMGDTPLVRLNRVAEGLAPLVLAKVEYFNPGGSVKDRIAQRMVEAAEAGGRVKPGGPHLRPAPPRRTAGSSRAAPSSSRPPGTPGWASPSSRSSAATGASSSARTRSAR